MKKLLMAVLVFFLPVSMAFSQQTNFGIKAGYNAASVEVTDGDDWNTKSGLHFGGLAHIHITSHFAVQPEVVFSMQGGEDANEKLKLNYINIPVLLQYMINDGFRLQTGPQAGFLISAERKVGNLEIDVDDEVSSFDFSWAFGAGYLFPSGIGVDARYNLGISNISESTSSEARNRVFQVGLFYQFMQNRSVKRN